MKTFLKIVGIVLIIIIVLIIAVGIYYTRLSPSYRVYRLVGDFKNYKSGQLVISQNVDDLCEGDIIAYSSRKDDQEKMLTIFVRMNFGEVVAVPGEKNVPDFGNVPLDSFLVKDVQGNFELIMHEKGFWKIIKTL